MKLIPAMVSILVLMQPVVGAAETDDRFAKYRKLGNDALGPALTRWGDCIELESQRYSATNEPSAVAADAAIAKCSYLESAYAKAASLTVAGDPAMFDFGDKAMRDQRASYRGLALTLIMDARLAKDIGTTHPKGSKPTP